MKMPLPASDRERENHKLKVSEVGDRISTIAANITELRALRAAIPHAQTPMSVWLHSCIDNKESELKFIARTLADGLKPVPKTPSPANRKPSRPNLRNIPIRQGS